MKRLKKIIYSALPFLMICVLLLPLTVRAADAPFVVESLSKTAPVSYGIEYSEASFRANFKDLFDTLETVSNGVVQLTPEMEKYTKQLKKAQEELENAEKARNEIVSKGKVDPTGKRFVNIGDFNKTIADLGAFRVKKDGNAYKTSMSDFATVYDRVVNKGEKVLTKDGVDISTTPE